MTTSSVCAVVVIDEFLHTLEHGPSHWAYLLVAAASGVEYVFPPIPGDTVALFAVALAVRAQLSWFFVYCSMTVGAITGGLAAWAFGLWLANHEAHWPGFMKTPAATRALDAVRRGYTRHGAMYLAVNRFLPALRAFFFVGAGLSRMNAANAPTPAPEIAASIAAITNSQTRHLRLRSSGVMLFPLAPQVIRQLLLPPYFSTCGARFQACKRVKLDCGASTIV